MIKTALKNTPPSPEESLLSTSHQLGIWFLFSIFYFLFSCQNLPKSDQKSQIPSDKSKNSSTLIPRPPDNYHPATGNSLTSDGENWAGSFSPDGKKILFLSRHRFQHEQSQVYEMDLIHLRQKRITYQDGENSSPHYDPSGQFIIYASTTDETKEDPSLIRQALERIQLKDSENHLDSPPTTPSSETKEGPALPNLFSASPVSPEWFLTPFELYRSTTLGSHIERLTTSKGYDAEGRYHPAHPSIVFTSSRSGMAQLYITSLNGKNINRLSRGKFIETEPQFQPGGHGIVFVRYYPDLKSSQIIYQDLNKKGSAVSLFLGKGIQRSPVWHPDGETIIYSSNQDDENNFELYSVHKNGACLQRLTYALGNDTLPDVSPDGRRILFSSTRDGLNQLYQMDYVPPSTCPNEKK